MRSKIDHIYWFASYGLISASTRYRGVMPLNYLRKIGIDSDFVFPERSLKTILTFISLYLKILFFRKKNSIIVIQKVFSNHFYGNALKLLIKIRNTNTVYDIDDAEQYRRDPSTINFFLKNCEYVSVGSDFLKNYCQGFNKNVFIQTSPVLKKEKINKSFYKNKKLHIGWVGDFGQGFKVSKSFSHKANLYKLFFPNLLKINFPIKLTLIGVKNYNDIPEIKKYFKDHPNIEINIPINLDWSNDAWLYQEISKFDVGISLMINHPFNQAKSAFKAKQYLVCGVPVIANDIGETSNFVFEKVNGFICNNDNEIVKALNIIKEMSDEEYKEISERCLKHINTFSMERYCEVLLKNTEHSVNEKSQNNIRIDK